MFCLSLSVRVALILMNGIIGTRHVTTKGRTFHDGAGNPTLRVLHRQYKRQEEISR